MERSFALTLARPLRRSLGATPGSPVDIRLRRMLRSDLTTERLFLTPPTAADAERITAVCQDSAIQRWTTVPSPYTLEDGQAFISSVVDPGWEETSPTWAIRERTRNADPLTSPLVGMIGLTSRGAHGTTAEIGFWAAPEARGRGLITEAVQAVLDFGFTQMGLQVITWHCLIDDGEPNWASTKVAWRTGFTFEGYARGAASKNGRAYDALRASILPSEPRIPRHAWFGPDDTHPGFADSRDPEALVRQFHETYRLPIVSDGPRADRERTHMRMSLVAEEFCELVGAIYGQPARRLVEETWKKAVAADDGTRDTVEAADALGDLVYVIYGMALELGIPMRDVLAEIQASNLSKLDAEGKPIYRADGKVLKGPNYFRPDIRRALGLD